MSKIIETRKARCRYGREAQFIKDFELFGWSLSSKQILNRFGNPLPLDERVSEDDLREKCFYELTFTREEEKEIADKLNSLQIEYSSEERLQTCFTGKRVTACVFITLAVLLFGILAGAFYGDWASFYVFFTACLIALGGFAAVIATGILQVVKNGKKNDANFARRKQIEREVEKLLAKE